MSVSSTEMKLELTNWAMAKLTPGDQGGRPGLLDAALAVDDEHQQQRERTTASSGVCRPTSAPISW